MSAKDQTNGTSLGSGLVQPLGDVGGRFGVGRAFPAGLSLEASAALQGHLVAITNLLEGVVARHPEEQAACLAVARHINEMSETVKDALDA